MSTVTIKHFTGSLKDIYSKSYFYSPLRYTAISTYGSPFSGKEAAEDAFDLTNNPSRDVERQLFVGNCRSVSVGDVVEVDGVEYFCAPMGWRVVDEEFTSEPIRI